MTRPFRVIFIDRRDGSISGDSFDFPESALEHFATYGKNENLEALFLNDDYPDSRTVRYSENMKYAAIVTTPVSTTVDFLYQDFDDESAVNYLLSKSVLGSAHLMLYSFKRGKVIVSEEFNGGTNNG